MNIASDINLLVIPSFYTSTDHPLRGIFFKEQADAISSYLKNSVVVYSESRSIRELTLSKIKKFHFQHSSSRENNLLVYRKHGWNIIPTGTGLTFGQNIWVRNVVRMVEYIIKKGYRPNLIHAHCTIGAGLAAYELFKLYQIPYIITEHSTIYSKLNFTERDKIVLRDVLNNAAKVITVSNPLKHLLSTKLGTKIDHINVIPNFIDTNFFVPVNNHNEIFTFVCVCHLSEKKRVDRLLESFAGIISKGIKARLIIGGTGDQMNSLKELTRGHLLEDSVFFKGELNRNEVRNLMQAADCFVLASDVETFGVVLIEALACGIPVIATKSGGPEDIITKECGYLAEKSSADLQKGMEHILLNKGDYNKSELRKRVMDHFSSTVVSKTYVSLYERFAVS